MVTARNTARNELQECSFEEYMKRGKASLARTIHTLYNNIKQQQRLMIADRLEIAFLTRTLNKLREESGWPHHKPYERAERCQPVHHCKPLFKKKVDV